MFMSRKRRGSWPQRTLAFAFWVFSSPLVIATVFQIMFGCPGASTTLPASPGYSHQGCLLGETFRMCLFIQKKAATAAQELPSLRMSQGLEGGFLFISLSSSIHSLQKLPSRILRPKRTGKCILGKHQEQGGTAWS